MFKSFLLASIDVAVWNAQGGISKMPRFPRHRATRAGGEFSSIANGFGPCRCDIGLAP
jgi:hypothetical protein